MQTITQILLYYQSEKKNVQMHEKTKICSSLRTQMQVPTYVLSTNLFRTLHATVQLNR